MNNSGNKSEDGVPCLIGVELHANQSIADGAAPTTVQWDVTALQEGPIQLETSTKAVLIAAGGDGVYQINVQLDYEPDNTDTGVRDAIVSWYQGSNYPSTATRIYRVTAHPGGGQNLTVSGGYGLSLAAGDRITVETQQTSGAAINLRGAGGGNQVFCTLTMARIST